MEEQAGDKKTGSFSFKNIEKPNKQKSCYITYTNKKTHEIIKKNTPFYLRGIMKDFSGVKDTNIYKTLKNGRTGYYFKVFQKI